MSCYFLYSVGTFVLVSVCISVVVIILFTIKQKEAKTKNFLHNHTANWKTKIQYFDNDLWMSHKEYEHNTTITTI